MLKFSGSSCLISDPSVIEIVYLKEGIYKLPPYPYTNIDPDTTLLNGPDRRTQQNRVVFITTLSCCSMGTKSHLLISGDPCFGFYTGAPKNAHRSTPIASACYGRHDVVSENYGHWNRHAPRWYPEAQHAFKDLMIHWVLQFALRIAFRCVLHRCESQDIRCCKL